MQIRKLILCLCLTFASTNLLVINSAAEEFRAANIFTDNMVIQRNEAFSIWGWANPEEQVTVELKDQKVSVRADDSGKWMTDFSPIQVGKPFEIQISNGTQQIKLQNVVAGEVWICSGQSNMEWPVNRLGNAKQESLTPIGPRSDTSESITSLVHLPAMN